MGLLRCGLKIVALRHSVKPATDEPRCWVVLRGRENRLSFVTRGRHGPGSSVAGHVQRRFSVKNPLQCNAFSLRGRASRLVCRGARAARPIIVRLIWSPYGTGQTRAPPMFGRATIKLGIGPHFSYT